MSAGLATAYFSGHRRGGSQGHWLYGAGSPLRAVYSDERRKVGELFMLSALDCGFLGGGRQVEGQAALWHRVEPTPWTVLSFWDRSGDSRPGCCASFLLQGRLGFEAAVEEARRHFPALFERFTFEVHLQSGRPEGRG
jgi:hypothetical protein